MTVTAVPQRIPPPDSKLTGAESYVSPFNHNLVHTVSVLLNFTTKWTMPPDLEYGHNINGAEEWNGLIGQLQRKEADVGGHLC